MSVPKNKIEFIFAIEYSYSKLKMDFINIPSELTKIKELEGHAKGTKISVSDLVAYLIGWGELVLKWNWKKENLPKNFIQTMKILTLIKKSRETAH